MARELRPRERLAQGEATLQRSVGDLTLSGSWEWPPHLQPLLKPSCISQALAPARPLPRAPLTPLPTPANTADWGSQTGRRSSALATRLLCGFRRVPRWQALGEEQQGTPQPTDVLQAHPVDSGDPGESPRPCSGPYIRSTLALIGTQLAMA